MYQYVVSAQKATAVSHAITGHFTGPEELNLIICKTTRIEVFTLTIDGLVAQYDLGIYGRIATCELYKPHGEACDLLFVATEKRQYFVLQFDSVSRQIITKTKGDIQNRINVKNQNGFIGRIDPDCRAIGLNLYQGQFEVIPMDAKGQLKNSFVIRLEEINVIDIQFLHGEKAPTICVLHESNKDNRTTRHIKTYRLNVNSNNKDAEFSEGPWQQPNVEVDTNMIIPVPEPLGGILIVGLQSIAYRSGRASRQNTVSIKVRCGAIRAFAPIDENGSRWLLADEWGGLRVLAIVAEEASLASVSSSTPSNALPRLHACDLSLEYLGETSIASALVYLDNGYVFVGSGYGDSQLIRLSEERNPETKSYLEIVQTTANIGPIMDFCVMDLDRQGQGQVVTCSGAYKDGSLRIIRNGIGIDEQASVELPGIKMMWSLRSKFDSPWDKYIVQSFTHETRILSIEDQELSEVDIAGLDQSDPTLFCCNMIDDMIFQGTSKNLRLVSLDSGSVFEWTPPAGRIITVVAANASQVLIALDGGELNLFKMENKQLVFVNSVVLDHEIACININPFDATDSDSEPIVTDVAAVGMWTDVTIRIFVLPSLKEIHREPLTGETIPRSLYCVSLKGLDRLFVGLGDGNLYTFRFNRGGEVNHVLTGKKKVCLGSRPVSLSKFRSRGAAHIFVGTDRPTVIYSTGTKLLYSNVNQKEVTSMVSFNSEEFPGCLAFASEDSLTVGTLDEIQKLDIKSVPLGEQPSRISNQASTGCLAVCTVKTIKYGALYEGDDIPLDGDVQMGTDSASELPETEFVKLFDNQTFELLDTFRLDDFERVVSMITCSFHDPSDISRSTSTTSSTSAKPIEYFVVGTAYVIEEEQEPSKGRILVFQVATNNKEGEISIGKGRSLILVTEEHTRGAVYALNAFDGKLLAGVNSKIILYTFLKSESDIYKLHAKGRFEHLVIVLFIQSHGDFIVVGDLMKSIILLVYRAVDDTIEEIARDYNANWMTSIGILNDDTFLGSESNSNLFTVQRNMESTTEEARHMLKVVGEYHLGESVNKICPGSLVMQNSSVSTAPKGAVSQLLASTSSSAMQVDTEDQSNLPAALRKILETGVKSQLLYGSVNGVLGVIASITEDQYKLLRRLEKALEEVIQGVGGLSHVVWRSFTNERKMTSPHGYVDGDLIEEYLDLDAKDMQQVVNLLNGVQPLKDDDPSLGFDANGRDTFALNLTVADLTRFVEDLSRIH